MKKLVFLLLFLVSISYSQYQALWQFGVGGQNTPAWFANDNSTRSLAYDKVNNFVYICSRTGGHNIYVLNANTGAVIDTLNVTGVSGGTFLLNMVKVADDGVIYAGNLALAGGVFKIYRWANKDDIQTLAYEAAVTSRYGDAMTVVGSGTNTIIYASGTGNNSIAVLTTTDGSTFTKAKDIVMPGAYASGSISPIDNTLNSQLWVKTAGFGAYLVNQNGTLADSVSTGVVHSGWRNIQYFTSGNQKFLAFSGRNDAAEGKRILVVNITAGAYYPRPAGFFDYANTYNTNGNATSDFAIKKDNQDNITIYNVITNNSYGAITISPMAYFQVNMKIKARKGEFNTTDPLFVRGSFNSWGTSDTLKDTDGDTIYNALVNLGSLGQKEYKFMFIHGGTDVWEGDPNRQFTANSLYTFVDGGYFNNDSLFVTKDSIYTYFACNMELERLSGRFNPASDTVSVNGSFQGWTPKKNILTPSGLNPDLYEGMWAIFAGVGEKIEFKFWYTPNNWESISNRIYTFTQQDFDTKQAVITGAFNNGSLETVINQNCTIKFTCNTNGAINYLTGQPFASVNSVHIAGSALPLQWPGGGWPNSDSTKVLKLYDDGTNGDLVAGDKIFSRNITFPKYTVLEVKYKYGINWGGDNGGGNDNEGGFGADHTLRMTKFMVSATGVDTFGKANVTFLKDIVTDVKDEEVRPVNYELSQNYPNPFNPTTMISFSIPATSFVTLKVYDMLGREVATLVNEQKSAGKYEVRFDAGKLSSGMYLYELKAGEFKSIKKMLLMK